MGKLKVDHIFKEYEKGKLVISDVCLEIDEGDFFVLLSFLSILIPFLRIRILK